MENENIFFSPNLNLEVEKVWSYQAGIESTALSGLWIKASAFRHNIDDAIVNRQESDGTFTKINKDKIRRQGIEFEIETAPIKHFSFKGGYIYQDVKNLETDEAIKDVAEYTIDLGLQYDDKQSLRGLLAGHYIWWDANQYHNGDYNDFIWDLNIIKRIHGNTELKIVAHNIFNGYQYLDELYRNPRRWIEGGITQAF